MIQKLTATGENKTIDAKKIHIAFHLILLTFYTDAMTTPFCFVLVVSSDSRSPTSDNTVEECGI
jgi:hypothetical protein